MPDLLLFDSAVFSARFAAALRRAGIPVPPERADRFLRALRLVPPTHRAELYWCARLVFVSDRDQVDRFDGVFDLIFGGVLDRAGSRGGHDREPLPPSEEPTAEPSPSGAEPRYHRPEPLPGGTPVMRPRRAAGEPAPHEATMPIRTQASTAEALAHKDLGNLEPEELAALDRLAGALAFSIPPRRGRRREADPAGRRIDLRRTLRLSLRTGGQPITLARSRNRLRPRKLVLLCDISGSMEPYTRAYLRLFPRLYARGGAAGRGVTAETFVFATRLTRLTPLLRHTDPDTALARAGAAAPDWSGGTRIGRSLRTFTDRHGRRGMARDAILVIFSDGWEGEDPACVGREMQRLARLAHRIVWVNPRKAAPGYAPLAGGMAAALPYCHAFVSGHTYTALAEVVDAVAGFGRRRRPAAGPAEKARP
jgi:uncharacterized protein with von Willebrand factor type A (vWA) domain